MIFMNWRCCLRGELSRKSLSISKFLFDIIMILKYDRLVFKRPANKLHHLLIGLENLFLFVVWVKSKQIALLFVCSNDLISIKKHIFGPLCSI